MRLGVHVPVGQGLVKAAAHARAIGCEAIQLFARNARGWRGRAYSAEELAAFRCALGPVATRGNRTRIPLTPLVVHSCYLVNLASPGQALREQSRRAVADDIARCAIMGGQFVVFHFGHHMGAGTNAGIKTVASGVRQLLQDMPPDIQLLAENSAARGTEMGGEWQEFAHFLDLLDGDERVGVCFDTCHAHAAGYRLDTPQHAGRTLRAVNEAIGLARVRLLHLNDCQAEAGSHVDHHEHIGKGRIGEAGFRSLLRRRELRHCAGILETPVDRPGDDRRNLKKAKALRDG